MFGFNVNKLKPSLKMAVHRIGIVKNKKAITSKAQRKEVAKLLADGKEEKARIRVEGLIREDFVIEAYEIIELLCELISERTPLIKSERECPYDMREAVCTLIWAATRTEIPELSENQLTKKYGQDFTAAAMRNVDGCVNERVIHKLSVQPPNAYLVINYLKEIAKQHNVAWVPDESQIVDPLAPMAAPTGTSIGQAGVSGPDFAAIYAEAPPPGRVPTAFPTVPHSSPAYIQPPSGMPTLGHVFDQRLAYPDERCVAPPKTVDTYAPPPAAAAAPPANDSAPATNDVPDFDELASRFEKLRRKN
ncbi:hypothetical protein DYB30_006903 [Aphanomyces astaci]|uniref:IST1 homolog n=1 Tax=Aphanomyces astaci TaxID=112090 RepID=A0A397CK16_APHAT|nr:hypothetical protein DYB36_000131 [Aphanomyces astaci]RHY41623.1 hypothetical protein DYB38_000786 [Aphanomyces astaci]RHY48037.1 hypothetical protein DYB30_006903 [Aphanomyces astaci]RHZ20955.1 hypothetical protein DYB31_004260 [Aphanomyces astaci]